MEDAVGSSGAKSRPGAHEDGTLSSVDVESRLNCALCTLRTDELQTPNAKQAIKLLIELVQAHKLELQERMASSLSASVFPLIAHLKDSGLSPSQKQLVNTLGFVLGHMASSFGAGLSFSQKRLSRREAQICGLIANGQDTRSIARSLGLTYQTVIVHRKNIRKKLGLKKNKQNLETYIRGNTPDSV